MKVTSRNLLTRLAVKLSVTSLLCVGACSVSAATILSDNLSSTSGGTEAAANGTSLAASFGTNSSSYMLNSVVLDLANESSSALSAQLALYSDDGLGEPGALISTVNPTGSYSISLTGTTFTATSVTLAANTSYWIVLNTTSGELDWSYAADDNGTGTGFQDRWAASYDTGSSWYSYSSTYDSGVDPLQMNVTATPSATTTPEPATISLLLAAGLVSGRLAHRRRTSSN